MNIYMHKIVYIYIHILPMLMCSVDIVFSCIYTYTYMKTQYQHYTSTWVKYVNIYTYIIYLCIVYIYIHIWHTSSTVPIWLWRRLSKRRSHREAHQLRSAGNFTKQRDDAWFNDVYLFRFRCIYNIYCAHIYVYNINTSSTAQGGGGSFKKWKPIGEIGCCESGMAERIHWWAERCLGLLSFSLSFSDYLLTYQPIFYVSIYLSLSLSLFHLITYLPICLSTYLPIYLSTYLPTYLSISLSLSRSFICLSV